MKTHNSARPRRARWPAIAGAIGIVAAGVIVGWGWHARWIAALPHPPAVKLEGVDPAVCRAIEEKRAVVNQTPWSAEAWGKLGMVLFIHEFNADANACFEQAERLDPVDPRWPYLHGISLAPEQPQAAAPLLQRAAELSGDRIAFPRLRLADVLLQEGRLEEADAQFRRVLRQDPVDPYALLGLGKIALARNHLDESAELLNQSLGDNRTQKASAVLLLTLDQRRGDVTAARGRQQEAAALPDDPPPFDPFFEQAVQLHTGLEAALERAQAAISAGDLSTAVTLMRAATRDYPGAERAWTTLAQALLAQKENAEAEDALRVAAGINPASSAIQDNLGISLSRQHKTSAAMGYFHRAIKLNPVNAAAHFNLAGNLNERGEEVAAAAELREAIRLKPGFVAAQALLAQILAHEGKRGEAVELLQRAHELNPGDAEVMRELQKLRRDDDGRESPRRPDRGG